MPADITVTIERLAADKAETTGPVQCFAGCSLLCAYRVKRWSDVQHTLGNSLVLSDDAVMLDTYKSKRKKQIMTWACLRRSISSLEFVGPWLEVAPCGKSYFKSFSAHSSATQFLETGRDLYAGIRCRVQVAPVR